MRKLKRDRKAGKVRRRALEVRQLQKRQGVLHKTALRLLYVLAGNRTVRLSRTFNTSANYVALSIIPSVTFRSGLPHTSKHRQRLPSITLQYDCQQGWLLLISGAMYRMRHGLPTRLYSFSGWKDVVRGLFELLREQHGLAEAVTATSFRRALSRIRSCAG